MEIFIRNVDGMTCKMQKICAGIAGCGGLGSNAAVTLTRSGIGRLILVDSDKVEPHNLNRQHFFIDDIGQWKVDALGRQLKAINPDIKLDCHSTRLSPADINYIFHPADLLIEALDDAASKRWLIDGWHRCFPDRPIFCGNGIAGFGRTDRLHIRRMENIVFCGDGETDMSEGLCASRVLIVANMQANEAIDWIMRKDSDDHR